MADLAEELARLVLLVNEGADSDRAEATYWAAVEGFAAGHGDAAALAAALSWCDSDEDDERVVGVDVAGVVARTNPSAVEALVARADLAGDTCTYVRSSYADALSTHATPGVTAVLLRLCRDADPYVRREAVSGLAFRAQDDAEPDGPVVEELLRAQLDPSALVRDWATFVLGSQLDADSERIREALRALLDDEELDVAGEAALGLARRRDPHVYEVLERRLSEGDVGNLYVEAAAELADPRLLPLVVALRDAGWADDDPRPWVLDDALAACGADSGDGVAGGVSA